MTALEPAPLANPVFPTVESRRRATPPRCLWCAWHAPTQGHDPKCPRPRKETHHA